MEPSSKHRRQGSESSASSTLSNSSVSTTASGVLVGSSSTASHATCAYPSWPGGRSLKASQTRDASSSRVPAPQHEAAHAQFAPSHQRARSSYSTGGSSFLNDDDLKVPESSSAHRFTPPDDLEDCVAPGYHCLSGRPRAPEPKFKWERNGDKTRKNSRPTAGQPKKADPRQQIRMPTKRGGMNG